jgi:hypothetical protein
MVLANSIKVYRPEATLAGYHGVSVEKTIAVIGGTGRKAPVSLVVISSAPKNRAFPAANR